MAPTGPSVQVKPVFIKTRDLPNTDDDDRGPITTREICGEAEKILGYGTMEGAQQIGGLWRVYPKSHAARMQLLIDGLALRKVLVRFNDENPFLVRNATGDGAKVDTTKLFISNIPISFSNSEIENKLININCKPVSKLIDECARDDNGKLTRWKTGRRFIFIAVPASPLPTQINIGPFTARLFHREQKANRQPFCTNCLQSGHRKDECKGDVVCRLCRETGHKAGESLCNIPKRGVGEATLVDPETKGEDEETTSGSESEADNAEVNSSSSEGKLRAQLQKKSRRKRKNKSGSKGEKENATPERETKIQKDQNSSVVVLNEGKVDT